MARISSERKQHILKKLLPPANMSVQEVSDSEGVSVSTIYKWRQEAKERGEPVPGKKDTADNWSSEAKLAAVMATGTMTEVQLSQYCREKGIYPEQIKRWKQDALNGFATAQSSQQKIKETAKQDKKKIKRLEAELRRKEKALAEAGAIIVLQKKYETLLMAREED